ncbi:MAG: glycoside hydrolase family 15 protein [Alphaproteobacteria bacterium]|nr:glycoside hydrolase family 15 protein [Alphaproteobacteria bacterium]
MAGKIEDYAMIGDLRTGCLIERGGSIDWFCPSRFDRPACFASLLGSTDNGRWLIGPRGAARTTRRYHPGSMVLETTHETDDGTVRVIDFMPIHSEHTSIVRLVKGLSGTVRMHTELAVRFDYGISVPWVNRVDAQTLVIVAGPDQLTLRTPVALKGKDMRSRADFTVHEGDFIPFVLTHSPSHLPPPAPIDIMETLTTTQGYWREWSSRCTLDGKHGDLVRRSLMTLKALSFQPTGGIVAALTTSLPELIGGPRNWDYRYCWLRDATFTLLAFLNAGYRDEADRWQKWLLRAIAGSPGQIQIMYGVAGERRLEEWTVSWLKGYEDSAPVRIGNAAAGQLQLDIYGELADVFAQASLGGLAAPQRRDELQLVYLAHLEKIWSKPDEGIWEIRGEPQHFVHSKAMAWVAFDRASRSETGNYTKAQRNHWRKIADEIHADICEHGVKNGHFTQHYATDEVDASLLQLALVGFLPPDDPRIERTITRIEETLMSNGFVLRYRTDSGVDGLPKGEGAFLACSFWLVDNYLLLGRLKDGEKLFERLVSLTNDVGLLAEEYDPRAKRMLGNFPQAFSHVALVNSAYALMVAREHRQTRAPGTEQLPRAAKRVAAVVNP